MDEKTLQNLQKKATAQFRELERIKASKILGKENQRELEEALKSQDLFRKSVDDTIAAQKEVNKEIGLVGTGIEGISKGLSKMGFGDFSQPLTEAIQKTKDARLQIKLNNDLAQENSKKLQESEAEFQNLKSTGYRNLRGADRERYKELNRERKEQQLIVDNMNAQNTELSTQTNKYKNIGNALKDQLTKANLIDFAIQQMVAALQKADNQTGQLAKAFGTSYSEAASLRNELNTVANLSGDVNITTGALQESLIAVNKEFGTATMFSGELLKDFTNMTKVMGYTDEAAAKLSKITVATGTDLSDNTAQILGTAAAFNVTNDLALNEKEIVEGVAKASAAVTVSLGMQPGKIAAAVVQAKALGLELEQVTGIAESLLNFESSISNELEAELLTGRSLNLEQARYLALTNDIEGVAKEIANQGITAAEFGSMNMIQQKAIAEAVGLTKEELAQSLINQQALTKLGNQDKTITEAYNRLKKEGLSDDQIAKKLGDDKLAQQMKSQSIQERFNATIEKLQEIFVSVAEPILQIVSPFMDLITTILPLINVVLQPTVNVLKSLGAIITTNILEPLKAVKEIFSGIIDIFKGDFKKGLIKIGSGLLRSIMTPFQAILNGITTFINGLIDMINAIPGIDIKSLNSIDLTTTIIDTIKDGKIDYQKGVVVSGGFGSVQLNEKDTFVGDKNGIKAGTNLFGNTFQTPPPASNNLFENIVDFFKIPPTSAAPPSITVDMAPLVNEMQAVKAVLVQILNKDSNVYMDGAKVGKGINMAKTKIG
jgi:hypothetical protein